MRFDLLNEPWIPVRDPYDNTTEVSLVEAVANAHRFTALAAESPIVNISLLRLLIAFSHRVAGTSSAEEWARTWESGRFDATAVSTYTSNWIGKFDLFDEDEPFFQCADLSETLAKPISILRFAQTNNPTLFDHTNVRRPAPMVPAEAARWLVTVQQFDVGGRKTSATGGGESTTAAPLVGAVVVTAEGATLFETVLLNMVRVDPPHDRPFPSVGTDAPAWERGPQAIESTSRRPDGHLDWLTFQSRRVRLLMNDSGQVDRVVITPGDRLHGLDQTDIEQFIAYRLTENRNAPTPWVPVRLDPTRAIWRNASAILSPTSTRNRRPRVLDWLDELRRLGHLERSEFTVTAGGVANDKSKFLMWRLEHHPMPTRLLDDSEAGALLEDALQLANAVGFALKQSLRPSGGDQEHTGFGPGSDDRSETDYWARAGQGFDDLIAGLAVNPAEAARQWAEHLRSSAEDAVQPLLGSGSGRHLRRVASSERRLRTRLRTALATFDETLESLT